MKYAALVLSLCLTSCGGGRGAGNQGTSPDPTPTPTPTPVTVTAADLTYCVSVMNTYRATVGRPPLAQDPKLEQIATRAAQQDYLAQSPHQHFIQTGGEGYSQGENEFGTSLSHYGSAHGALDFGIGLFWAEGPSGGHYQNIVNFTRAGCGYYRDGDTIYVAADFR